MLRPHRLTRDHIHLMVSLVEGGRDAREEYQRLFCRRDEQADERVVRSTIAWIRDEFAAAVKREHRPGVSRLVVSDARRLADPAHVPTLDEFAALHGLSDFSQAEQLQAYQAEHGYARPDLKRRGLLIKRQREALFWLESLVSQPPRAGDAVSAWLHPALARQLEAAGILTLAQLVERIDGVGLRWHAGVRGIGQGKAQRIVDWLRSHDAVPGLRLGRHVRHKRSELFAHELGAVVAPATDIRPLEKFIVPAELDGSRGLYRRPQQQCLLQARNDHEAILAWLRAKHGLSPAQRAELVSRRRQRTAAGEGQVGWLQSLSHTQRSYRKEAERFVLWAIVARGKALSSMTNEDCSEYRAFLADPQPRSRWCGPRSRERWSPLWRPFEGPLSASAQRQAVTVLKNLYGFLVDQNYLMGNPWSAVGVPRTAGPRVNAGRSFTQAQWRFIETELDRLPATSASQRLKVALRLLYATGLRRSEIVAATAGDLQWVEYASAGADDGPVQGWLLRVVGKGEKERQVPVPSSVVEDLAHYFAARGLPRDLQDPGNRGVFLLGQAGDASERAPGLNRGRMTNPRQGIAATTLYSLIKAFFRRCAGALQDKPGPPQETARRRATTRAPAAPGQPIASPSAERFLNASTHWLRHSHASHAIASGMPIEMAQQNLGHASLATTTVYVTSELRRRMGAVEAFWKG